MQTDDRGDTMKTCKHCEKPLVQREIEQNWQFKTRTYCGRDCANKSRITADPPKKPCRVCGELFGIRKNGEMRRNFAKRLYCAPKCAKLGRDIFDGGEDPEQILAREGRAALMALQANQGGRSRLWR